MSFQPVSFIIGSHAIITRPDYDLRKTIIDCVEESVHISIDLSDVTVKGRSVTIRVNSLKKSEIYLNMQRIRTCIDSKMEGNPVKGVF